MNRAQRRLLQKQKLKGAIKMSEENKRSKEDINKEYTQVCQAAGDLAYRIEVLKGTLNSMLSRMEALNKEVNELNEATNGQS